MISEEWSVTISIKIPPILLEGHLLTQLLKEKIIFDLRNIYIPEDLKEMGFEYYGTGK